MQRINNKVSNFAGLFLILVYCSASYSDLFFSQDIENHVHEHEHGITLEEHILISSDCHNAIYHAIDEDCGHSEHFSKKEYESFNDVEFTLQKEYLAETEINVIPKGFYASPSKTIFSGYSNSFYNTKSSRGPPVFVI